MRIKLTSALLLLAPLLTSEAVAQAPSPAQVGLTTVDPNAVQIRDSSGTWTTIGTIDPATHLFSPAGVGGVLPVASTTILGGVKIDGTTINIDSSGVISGTPPAITANSTPTSGFVADQLLKSDGTKIQLVGDNCTNWTTDVRYPLDLCGYSSYPSTIYISAGNYGIPTGIGFSAFVGNNSAWATINNGTSSEYGGYGFIHSTNDASSAPDAGIMSFAPAVLSVIDQISPTTASSLRTYNTRTDNNNGEWGALDWQIVPDTLTIGTEANGTGTQRPVNIVGNPVTINGAAVPDGSITAGLTPTIGFNNYQMMVSDGTKIQAVASGSYINLGDTTYPIYMQGLNNTQGVWGHVNFSYDGADTGVSIWPGYYYGVGVSMPGGPLVAAGPGFFGFFTSTNTATTPDVAFTAVGPAIAAFRSVNGNIAENLRVYNAFTDYSNGEWGEFDWQSTPNTLTISTEANGTGAVQNMLIGGASVPDLYLRSGNATMEMASSGWVTLTGSWNASSAAFYFNNISVSGSITVGSSVGVSCAAGTVSLTTLVVTQGIITHC
jgi:hypothetical protein